MIHSPPKTLQYKGLIPEPAIQNFFSGRIWSRHQTPFPQAKIETYITYHYFNIIPAITITSRKWRATPHLRCNRCHNENQQQFITFHCARCEKACHYCRHCINMGRICSCEQLIIWQGPSARNKQTNPAHSFYWQGQFTPAQQQASDELTHSIQAQRNHLLHAVCGAGKTEVLFQAIHAALIKGSRVCVATPRTDVVLELAPRFQQVFPHTTIHALYGGAPMQTTYAPLIITTTHQLYRFQHAFDVIIVDEADAFPYTMDASLQQAVQKAKKPSAPIAYVTATPSAKLLKACQQQNWGYSFISRRYHGHDLPIPSYQSLWNYDKNLRKGKIPEKLKQWILQKLQQHEPFLLFFPTVELMEIATPLLQGLEPTLTSVHAEDPDRKEKVMQLRSEEIKGLLTTTILERGITIKNVQVAVVGAESPIFTASALIQISGRVGRNQQFPIGDIIFFHHGITAEMDAAIEEMKKLNKGGIT